LSGIGFYFQFYIFLSFLSENVDKTCSIKHCIVSQCISKSINMQWIKSNIRRSKKKKKFNCFIIDLQFFFLLICFNFWCAFSSSYWVVGIFLSFFLIWEKDSVANEFLKIRIAGVCTKIFGFYLPSDCKFESTTRCVLR
jgi:hypothetical protein